MSRANLGTGLRQSIIMMILFNLSMAQESGELVKNPMHCLWSHSSQLVSLSEVVRILSINVVQDIEHLITLKDTLQKFKITLWKDQYIKCDLSTCLFLGDRFLFTDLTQTISQAAPPSHRILLEPISIKNSDGEGRCKMDGKELVLGLCVAYLKSTAKLNGFSLHDDPPSETDLEASGSEQPDNSSVQDDTSDNDEQWEVSFLTESRGGLHWVGENSSLMFIARINNLSSSILMLLENVRIQMKQIINSLGFVESYYPTTPPGCNYLIYASLVNKLKQKSNGTLTNEEKARLIVKCKDINEWVLKKNRISKRGLTEWLFSDNSKTIDNLISAQHLSVKTNQVIEQNLANVNNRVKDLSAILKTVAETDFTNLQSVRTYMLNRESEITLREVISLLTEKRLYALNHIEDLKLMSNIVQENFKIRLSRIIDAITPGNHCEVDRRRISCQNGQGHMHKINGSQLYIKSPASKYIVEKIHIPACLFTDSSKSLFRGAGKAFILRNANYYHANFSIPERCVKIKECEGFVMPPPHEKERVEPRFIDPVYFILNDEGGIYMQALRVTTVTKKDGSDVPLDIRPLLFKEEDFPLTIGDKTYPLELFIEHDEEPISAEYFLNQYSVDYFRFNKINIRAEELNEISPWIEIVDDTQALFNESFVFRAVSISAIVITSVGLVCIIILVSKLCCFRRPKAEIEINAKGNYRLSDTYRSFVKKVRGLPRRPNQKTGNTKDEDDEAAQLRDWMDVARDKGLSEQRISELSLPKCRQEVDQALITLKTRDKRNINKK